MTRGTGGRGRKRAAGRDLVNGEQVLLPRAKCLSASLPAISSRVNSSSGPKLCLHVEVASFDIEESQRG